MSSIVFVAAGLAAFGVFVALAYRRRWQWTGLPAPRPDDRRAKTLWDWLQLLVIPVALAALAFLLNDAQSRRDQQREDQRAAQQRRTAADADRENTLRKYLTQMSDLMLDRRLLRSKPGADVHKVARSATLTALRRLDGRRRGSVIRFLVESQLLRRGKNGASPVRLSSDPSAEPTELANAELALAKLRAVNLRGANLGDANLYLADLRGANLRGAYPGEADLGADLSGADLRGADLRNADLRNADLRNADLRGANLGRADLRDAREADLAGSRGTPAHLP